MNERQIRNHFRRTLPARQARRLFKAFRNFYHLEVSGGIVLMVAAAAALLWANSPWAASYFELWHTNLSIGFAGRSLSHDLHWWINEALMVVFFFVVGLEIKREVLVGELSSLRQAALPIAAALGGMLMPALLYLWVTAGTPEARGWGVPMATDIAFALGVLALLGPRVPVTLKVFLTALAIVDDLGAVMVIALFYTGDIVWLAVFLAGVVLILLILANVLGARSPILYALLGVALWLMFLESGLHATIAGVLLAMTIPARGKISPQQFLADAREHLSVFEQDGSDRGGLLTGPQQEALQSLEDTAQEVETPLQRLEHALHPWVTFAIIPLFALANAGVALGNDLFTRLTEPISLGVIVGLVAGKQIGVTLAAWLAVKARLADLPQGVTWRDIYGVGWLAGIGFTMSLFIASLAFTTDAQLEAAKIGILAASLVAGIVGFIILRRKRPEPVEPL